MNTLFTGRGKIIFFLPAVALLMGLKTMDIGMDEHKVKAMFIINFLKHVDWPPEQINASVIKIGVAGESSVTEELKAVAEYKKSNQKQMEVVQFNPEEPVLCHVIFVPKNETRHIGEIAKKFAGKGVLIISEEKANTHAASITLIKAENKIKFEVNQSALRQAGLRLSSQLLTLASVINP